MQAKNSPLIVVLGPTGAGKSALALHLASRFNGEILGCDSVQVYRGLEVGSAKTPPAERRSVPHHLIDVVEPHSYLTAGSYARLARHALLDITARLSLPIVAGGTGLYLRSLLDGLSPAPGRDPALRERLKTTAERRPTALHRLLRTRDPAAALRIHPNDHQKLIRAIELGTRGNSLPPRDALAGYAVLKIGLNPPRLLLHERINQRSAGMFHHLGLLAETQALLNSGLPVTAKALQNLGYRQAVAVLTGETNLEAAIAECQIKTRQYAKRQITWFRREPNVRWLEGFGDDASVQAVASQWTSDFLLEH